MKKITLPSVAAIALLVFGSSAPAFAAQTRTLPDGETLFAVDCQGELGQVATVNATTAVATALSAGNPGPNQDCAADGGWDPVSGFAYYPAWIGDPDALFKVDISSGSATFIADIVLPGSPVIVDVSGGIMFNAEGVSYISFVGSDSDNISGQWVGQLNVVSGEISNEQKLTVDGSWVVATDIYSSDYNPTDGKFYFISGQELLEVNMANGEAISHGEKPSDTSWAGLAIDSNGVLWSTGSEYVSSSTVAGWSTVGNEEMTVAKVKVDGADWYSESNFINWTVAPDSGEELAPTGGNALIAGALVALSVLALAAGVVTRRATRRHRA